MNTQQQLVGAGAIGLVVVNVWTGKQRPALAAVVSGSGATADTHTAAKQVGLELLGAGVLTLLAGGSSKAGNACLMVLVCLWVLWFVHRSGSTPALDHVGTTVTGAGKRVAAGVPHQPNPAPSVHPLPN